MEGVSGRRDSGLREREGRRGGGRVRLELSCVYSLQGETQPVSEAVEFDDIWSLPVFPHVGGASNSWLVSFDLIMKVTLCWLSF